MEQHHYNLSSGSNLNPECPLPTVLRVLESAGSLLKSFLYLFSRIIAKVFFFFLRIVHISVIRLSLFTPKAVCTHFVTSNLVLRVKSGSR